MSDQKPLIKLSDDGLTYIVDKAKLDIVFKYMISRPYVEVGGILQGLLAFNTQQQLEGQDNAGQVNESKN